MLQRGYQIFSHTSCHSHMLSAQFLISLLSCLVLVPSVCWTPTTPYLPYRSHHGICHVCVITTLLLLCLQVCYIVDLLKLLSPSYTHNAITWFGMASILCISYMLACYCFISWTVLICACICMIYGVQLNVT